MICFGIFEDMIKLKVPFEITPTFTEQKYYNVAIDFAKEALRLQKKEEGVRAMLPAQLESLQKIKKDLITLNNG